MRTSSLILTLLMLSAAACGSDGDKDDGNAGDGDGDSTMDGGPGGDGDTDEDASAPRACELFEGFEPYQFANGPQYTAEEIDTCLNVTCPNSLANEARITCIETQCGQDAVDFFNCQYANIIACASEADGPCRSQFATMACCDVESNCPALPENPTQEQQDAALMCFNTMCATEIAGWDMCIDSIYASGGTAIPSRCLRPERIGIGVCVAPSEDAGMPDPGPGPDAGSDAGDDAGASDAGTSDAGTDASTPPAPPPAPRLSTTRAKRSHLTIQTLRTIQQLRSSF